MNADALNSCREEKDPLGRRYEAEKRTFTIVDRGNKSSVGELKIFSGGGIEEWLKAEGRDPNSRTRSVLRKTTRQIE